MQRFADEIAYFATEIEDGTTYLKVSNANKGYLQFQVEDKGKDGKDTAILI